MFQTHTLTHTVTTRTTHYEDTQGSLADTTHVLVVTQGSFADPSDSSAVT